MERSENPSLRKQWWIVAVLVLASFHCVQSIFYDDYSYIDLQRYEAGQERLPFQARVGMMPLLRAVHGNAALSRLARSLQQDQGVQHIVIEPYTAEKLASYAAGVLSMVVMAGAAGRYGFRRFPRVWWLFPAVVLGVFYASYAARADQNLWYPYDLPHAALFTLGALALLEGHLALVALWFALDVPMRETALFLLPCVLAVGWVRGERRRAALLAAGMAVFWLAVRIAIARHFPGRASGLQIPYHVNGHDLLTPKHWPQLMSVFGFLGLPLVLNLRRLTPPEKAFLLGAVPGVALAALLGIWEETRVWVEWNAAFACLAATLFCRFVYETPTARQAEL